LKTDFSQVRLQSNSITHCSQQEMKWYRYIKVCAITPIALVYRAPVKPL